MITDSIVRLVLRGKVDIDTAVARILVTSEPVTLTEQSTTADVILANATNLVPETVNLNGGYPAKLSLKGDELCIESASPAIQFGSARYASTVITYLSGTYGGMSNPLVSVSQVEPDHYYTIAGIAFPILRSARG